MYTVDELSIPAIKHAALGQLETRYWSQDLKNDANVKFVGDYRKKYGGKTPSYYGAQSYDGILLIDSAVRGVKGNLADKKGMIAVMRKADFASTRGKFKYGQNHFPIENFYLLKTVAGKTPTSDPVMEIQQTVFKPLDSPTASVLPYFVLHSASNPQRIGSVSIAITRSRSNNTRRYA